MRIMGLAGWSGAGKTTLLVKIIPLLTAHGLRVSTIKHAHHDFDIDKPGKDSWMHRQAGATEVLVASGRRWALMHELRGEPEPALPALLGELTAVDLVLIEGYKSSPCPKLEVHRPSLGKPPIWTEMTDVIAVASDEDVDTGPRTMLPLNQPEAVAAWVLSWISRADGNSS